MRIDAMIFATPSMTITEEKEFAYIKVENMFMLELSEADTRDEIHDILYSEINNIIEQYSLHKITADMVIPEIYSVWGISE